MKPKLCVSILPQSIDQALVLIGKAEESHPDFIELRLDCLETDCDLVVLAADRKTPLIATDKNPRTPAERRAILLNAAKSGFEYVDIDLNSPTLKGTVREIKASGAKCIVSFHDCNGTPNAAELTAVLKRQLGDGAEVCKIVTTAQKLEDNLTLLQFISQCAAEAKLVCFAMGELGKTSRLLSPVFGGVFTFASLERGGETAPGQMTLHEMRAAYELLGLE
jgi:3-dehydroquinate dehydratase type I